MWWEDKRPVRLVGYFVVFVFGYASAVAVGLLQQGSPQREEWLLLMPFLIAVTLFVVAVVVFAFQARADFRGEGARVRTEVDQVLGAARSAFEQKLGESCAGLREGVESLARESHVVYEDDFESYSRESHCYQTLRELVAKAKKSIFVIPNPYREGQIDTWELPPRRGYLEAIEDRVMRMEDDPDFEYMRFQQVPRGCADLGAHVGRSATDHMLRLEEMVRAKGKVQFRVIDRDEISGQMIIDGSILVKFLCGVDQQGNQRLFGITVMRDPTSTEISGYYHRLRTNLLGNSRKLDLDALRQDG